MSNKTQKSEVRILIKLENSWMTSLPFFFKNKLIPIFFTKNKLSQAGTC